MYSLRFFNRKSKDFLRLFTDMSKFSNGGRSARRISRIYSHLLYPSNRTNLKSLLNCNTASNSSTLKSRATEMNSDKAESTIQDDDLALPNETWTQESLELFNKLKNEADKSNGLWVKYKNPPPPQTGNRLFVRCLEEKGKMFEYCFFMNKREEHLKGVLQFGPYTEGPIGLVHGGAISTIMDSIIGVCINRSGYLSVTANLSVDFKVGVPIGTTVLLESRVDRVEGRKVFGYGEMKSADGSITYATSTALFIQVYKSTQLEEKTKKESDP